MLPGTPFAPGAGMVGRIAPLLSLSLLALTAIACAPKQNSESAGDTDTTSTSDTTGATETGATETGATETGATSGDSSATDTAGDACPASDPAAVASVALDFGAWPLVPDAYPDRIEAIADCTVKSATSVDGTSDLALQCSGGDQVDMPIGIAVTGPADFAVDLVEGAAVKLAGSWEGDAVDYVGGQRFALHDAQRGVAPRRPGLHFTEVLRGQCGGAPMAVQLTVIADDLDAFLRDPEHRAALVGTALAPGLSAAPLTVTEASSRSLRRTPTTRARGASAARFGSPPRQERTGASRARS